MNTEKNKFQIRKKAKAKILTYDVVNKVNENKDDVIQRLRVEKKINNKVIKEGQRKLCSKTKVKEKLERLNTERK